MSAGEESKVRFGSAVRWAAVMSWGQEGVAALTSFALALLLGPKDFGLVSLAIAYVGVFDLLAAQGLVTAVVQGRKVEDRDLDVLFWYTMGCGLLLAVVAGGSGGVVSQFFGLPDLKPIVHVLALGTVLRAATVVHEAKLIREMRFQHLAIRMNASVFVSAAVGIGAALAGAGAWAVVAQYLTKGAATMVTLWGASGWFPAAHGRSKNSRSLIAFSWKSFPATLFEFTTSQVEPLVLGKLFGEVAVGVYRMASRIVDLVLTIVTRALWHVSFPYLAEAGGDPEKLRERIGTCMRYSMLFTFPIASLMALECQSLVDLFGEEWAAAVPVVRVLSVYAAIRSLILFNGPLLLALGRPRTFSLAVGAQCLAVVGSITLVALWIRSDVLEWQLIGVAWARVAAYGITSLPVLLWIVLISVRMPLLSFLKVTLYCAAIALGVSMVDYVALVLSANWATHEVASFAVRVVVVGCVTLGVIVLADGPMRTSLLARWRGHAAVQTPGKESV